MLATEGLSGPVGIAVDPDDNFYVANCRANAVTFVTDQGEVSDFGRSELFACPNGIVRLSDGTLLVTNFSNNHIVRVDTNGAASIFATLPTEKGVHGNAHLAIARDHVYVTRIKDNYIYRIALAGRSIVRVAGNGTPIDSDGAASSAGVARPNGIASGPFLPLTSNARLTPMRKPSA